jgi:phosphatidylglycerol---prolipoprotein diacylglyceryl transferase
VFTAICAIVGSRLLYIVTNLEEFKTWKDMLAIRSGGLVAYGGFLGGFLGSWYFCARRKIRLLAWADAAVPSLASGLLFTRIGCYLFGCDFGKPLSEKAPKWLQKLGTFPEWHYDHKAGKFLDSEGLRAAYQDPGHQILQGSPAWVQHTESFPQVRDLHHSIPVHPTQLYESLAGALLLGALFLARNNIKKREAAGEPFFRGELFIVFTFGYGVLRFLIEIVRDDIERKQYGPFLEPHIIVPLALMGFALAFVFGLSNMFSEKGNRRVIARSVAILIPFVVFMLMKPANRFELVEKVQLSTSQWIGILTGMAAAAYYRIAYDNAVADPVAAADLGEGVPALLEAEALAEAEAAGEPRKASTETDDDDADKDVVVAKPKRAQARTMREAPKAKRAESKKSSDDDDAETAAEKAESSDDADEAKPTKPKPTKPKPTKPKPMTSRPRRSPRPRRRTPPPPRSTPRRTWRSRARRSTRRRSTRRSSMKRRARSPRPRPKCSASPPVRSSSSRSS